MAFPLSLQQLAATAIFAVVLKSMVSNTDFERELGFYGAYHQDPMNQAIHFFFVPTIWWSIAVAMAYVPFPFMNGVSCALAQFVVYSVYYLLLSPMWGAIFSVVLFMLYLQAELSVRAERRAGSKYHGWKMWQIALFLHTLSWWAQIHPGHAVFEGIKPALLDSLGQSFGVAPLFAFLEGVWAAGFAPELHSRVGRMVALHREAMCARDPSGFSFCG